MPVEQKNKIAQATTWGDSNACIYLADKLNQIGDENLVGHVNRKISAAAKFFAAISNKDDNAIIKTIHMLLKHYDADLINDSKMPEKIKSLVRNITSAHGKKALETIETTKAQKTENRGYFSLKKQKPDMKKKEYLFYKEADSRWYIDLPDWAGPKSDLEMVAGADTMLDMISNNTTRVRLTISESNFDGAERLILKEIDKKEGAFYIMKSYEGKELNLEMWLCDVTLYVMGGFPQTIFIKNVEI